MNHEREENDSYTFSCHSLYDVKKGECLWEEE